MMYLLLRYGVAKSTACITFINLFDMTGLKYADKAI